MEQQLNTFKELFPILNDGGIYIVEDIESSYLNMYGGGYKRRGTFVEFSKNIIDFINANHSDFKILNQIGIQRILSSFIFIIMLL